MKRPNTHDTEIIREIPECPELLDMKAAIQKVATMTDINPQWFMATHYIVPFRPTSPLAYIVPFDGDSGNGTMKSDRGGSVFEAGTESNAPGGAAGNRKPSDATDSGSNVHGDVVVADSGIHTEEECSNSGKNMVQAQESDAGAKMTTEVGDAVQEADKEVGIRGMTDKGKMKSPIDLVEKEDRVLEGQTKDGKDSDKMEKAGGGRNGEEADSGYVDEARGLKAY